MPAHQKTSADRGDTKSSWPQSATPGHGEYQQCVEWVGGGFDPGAFDVAVVGQALDLLTWTELPVWAVRLPPS